MVAGVLLAAMVASSLFAAVADPDAAPGDEIAVVLENGDVLNGLLVEIGEDTMHLDHPLLGRIELPRRVIVAVRGNAPDSSRSGSMTAMAVAPHRQAPLPADGPWKGEGSFGMSGSQGNADRFSLVGGIKASQQNERLRWKLAGRGSQAEDSGRTSSSFATGSARRDFLFEGTRWEAFASNELEYDAFKDYDLRWGFSAGPGYRWFGGNPFFLLTRLGFGASREFGGEHDAFAPEVLLALESVYAISATERFYLEADVLPALDELFEFRAVVQSGLEVDLGAPLPVALRVGIEDRYESETPNGIENNDFDYSASLVRKF